MRPAVQLLQVEVLDNPAPWTAPMRFKLWFEVLCPVAAGVDIQVAYLVDDGSTKYDQLLSSVDTGPLERTGLHALVLDNVAPLNIQGLIREQLGFGAIVLDFSYKAQRFVRVGYFVHNTNVMDWRHQRITGVQRRVVAEDPRIFSYPIDWSL